MPLIKIPGVEITDPSKVEESKDSFLIMGHLNRGKSFVAADALKYYQQKGMEVLYIATPGENPEGTIAQFELGQCFVRTNKLGDFESVTKAIKGKIDVLVIDSLKGLQRMVMDQLVGRGKTPEDYKLWVPTHDRFRQAIIDAIANTNKYVIALCPSDRSVDSFLNPQIKGQPAPQATLISAELDGKQTTKVGSLFQQAGYIESKVVKDTDGTPTVTRQIHFEPDDKLLTRTNGLASPIVKPIELKQGIGVWEGIIEVFTEHGKKYS